MERKKILLIDDELFAYWDEFRALLEKRGVDIDMAQDIEGAKEFIKSKKYDLMIVDISLAGRQNGLDLVKDVRRADKSTPLYILTAYSDMQDKAKNAGADRYIEKPLDVDKHILKPLGVI